MGLLARLERRNSPENPTTQLSNPAQWLYEAFGASPSHSGVSVNNAKANTVAAWFQGVNIIAKGVASTPLKTFREIERGRETAKGERVYHLLKTRPNVEQTAFDFHRCITASQVSWGNGYAEIEWQKDGNPLALWWLPPSDCRVVRTGSRSEFGLLPRTKYVAVKIPQGADPPTGGIVHHNGEAYLPPGKYIHIPGLSFDGLAGANVAGLAKQALGLSLTLQQFIAQFFAHGAKAATIIQPKEGNNMGPDARAKIVRNLSQQIGGLSGAHRIAAVEAGVDVHTIGVSPQAAEFMALFIHTTKQAAQFLDIPPYRMGADENGQSYASITAKQIDLLTWTHLPMLIQAGQVYTYELMPDRAKPLEARRYYCEFSYNAGLRAEPKVRAETDALRRRNGLATINEIREEHNMNPHDSPEADMLYSELNLMPLTAEVPAKGEPRSVIEETESRAVLERRGRLALLRQRLRRAQVPVFVRMAEKILGRETEGLRRLLTRVFSSANPLAVIESEIDRFHDDAFDAAFKRDLLPLVDSFAGVLAGAVADELGRDVSLSPEIHEFLGKYADAAAANHVRSSRGQLLTIIEEYEGDDLEELHGLLTDRLDKWSLDRAGMIAENHTVRAGGALAVELYAAAGVVSLVWVGGDCPLCSSLNGRVVGTRNVFLSAGSTVTAEGANPFTVDRDISHPPLHPPSCDCVILAA